MGSSCTGWIELLHMRRITRGGCLACTASLTERRRCLRSAPALGGALIVPALAGPLTGSDNAEAVKGGQGPDRACVRHGCAALGHGTQCGRQTGRGRGLCPGAYGAGNPQQAEPWRVEPLARTGGRPCACADEDAGMTRAFSRRRVGGRAGCRREPVRNVQAGR